MVGPTTAFFTFLFVIFLIGLFFWAFAKRRSHMEEVYNKALQSNQVQLDQQTSRINILIRAIPNLRSLLSSPTQDPNTWKTVFLDEGRALILCNGASYWRFIEKEQLLELEFTHGLDNGKGSATNRIPLNHGLIGQAAKGRLMVLGKEKINGEEVSSLNVPVVISGNLWGLFRFLKRGENHLSQRDADLINMVVQYLSLTLENRDMVTQREKFYLELVQTLAETIDSRDASTQGQSRRARELARRMAKELDLPEEFTYYLEFAALVHDIGKIAIDEQLLKKPGKLTPQEFEIVKKHPEFGHKILSPVTMLAPVAPMVLYHQEWFNGKGYPEGLSGEEIPLGARIVAILDAWGAMTNDRPWRKALSIEQCIEEVKKGAGTQFDPQVVEAFIVSVKNMGLLDKK